MANKSPPEFHKTGLQRRRCGVELRSGPRGLTELRWPADILIVNIIVIELEYHGNIWEYDWDTTNHLSSGKQACWEVPQINVGLFLGKWSMLMVVLGCAMFETFHRDVTGMMVHKGNHHKNGWNFQVGDLCWNLSRVMCVFFSPNEPDNSWRLARLAHWPWEAFSNPGWAIDTL